MEAKLSVGISFNNFWVFFWMERQNLFQTQVSLQFSLSQLQTKRWAYLEMSFSDTRGKFSGHVPIHVLHSAQRPVAVENLSVLQQGGGFLKRPTMVFFNFVYRKAVKIIIYRKYLSVGWNPEKWFGHGVRVAAAEYFRHAVSIDS